MPFKSSALIQSPAPLLADIRDLILSARQQVARAVDAGLLLLDWKIGDRIRRDILREKRATYGEEIVATLSQQLTPEFGRGFSRHNLSRMIVFNEEFPDPEIVATLSQQLGWSHFVELVPIKDRLKREFYVEMCRLQRWSVRLLRGRIDSMLFERTAISRKPDKTIENDLRLLREEQKLTPDLVFRDPYLLDFLGLQDSYVEKDVEAGILREMEAFILELGVGFAFLERQKRITVDGVDHYLDLLFFHRHLRRLVAIDLKLQEFKPGDKGQMELYLRWLDRYERKPGEEAPIGLILCAGKRNETIELLDLERSGIKVSSYWTEVLPKAELERKLHQAVLFARARLQPQDANAKGGLPPAQSPTRRSPRKR